MYKLLTHNDLDGIGCGILAKLAFGDQVDVRYNSISSLNREVEFFLEKRDKETFLFITDLSVNEENEIKLEEFYKSGGKVKLIDHHKSAVSFNNYEWGHVEVENKQGKLTSATSLYYDYLISQQLIDEKEVISEFVELVRQYDTWEWEKNNNIVAKRLNTLFFLVSMDHFEETMLLRLKENDHFFFNEFENKILEMEEDSIERYIRRKKRQLVQTESNGHFIGVIYAELYHSELGNELGKEYPHLDYIVILNIGSKRMGFRTIHDDVDVSEIAATYGGGGHAKASGASLSEEAYKTFVAGTFHIEPLRIDAKRNKYNVKGSSFGTLYQGQNNQVFFIYPLDDGLTNWKIKNNGHTKEETFENFEEAEKYIKRHYQVWLEKDEQFVQYLMDEIKTQK
ncbi:DHH family phosphoesterase [Aquibacillus kalidii]|uniref:DHH family phosphoesterase n=1 Tax=Aquibacillus kalidii TaxID=2762597 RepID=UPI001645F905|nr:oligoribonuclease [Aquibacillus kalidii]